MLNITFSGNTAHVHIDASVGGPMGLGGHAPPVMADFNVTLNANGNVRLTGARSPFPSFEAYSYGNSGRALNTTYTETPKSQVGPIYLIFGEDVRVPR